MAPNKVELYLYDLSNGLASQLSLQLTGKHIPAIWHSSIVVFNEEIFFGQGISRCRPGQSHHGMPVKVVPLGETHIDKATFEEYIQSLMEVYTAEKYHLLDFNCNNFTNDVAGFLTGGQIPQDVIDLPREFLSTPFGMAMRPQIDSMFRRAAPGTGSSLPPAGPNGIASQLMNNVAQSAYQPPPSAPYANGHSIAAATGQSTVSSSLSIATNMASFQSILSSNKCVAVMFTGEWCGPCKIVKPVFEQLAKRGPDEPPVAFVLVDTTAGREIASQYNISAVPTFKFFLNGKQQHEIKGADAGELKTQVQLLAMSGYPPHVHMKLKLNTLKSMSLAPILYEQKPNFDAAITKLGTFAADNEAVKTALNKAKSSLSSLADSGRMSQGDLINTFEQVQHILQALKPEQCFPLFDILKHAVLQSNVADLAAESIAAEQNIVVSILDKGTSSSLTRPSQITLLRLLCNCFSNTILASRLLMEGKARSKISSILVQALLESDNSVRIAAGSLAYNVACWLRKQRKVWRDDKMKDDSTMQEQEEFEIELCSALIEALERENTLEVAHRLLASLGQLLLFSPHFETGLSPIAEALEAKRIIQSKKEVLQNNAEAVKLIKEVSDLVEAC